MVRVYLMEDDLLTISSREAGIIVMIKAAQLHMYHIPDFKEIMQKALGQRPARVIIDLERVQYLDSSAMGAFFQLHKDVVAYGGRMVLVHVNQTIRMVFKLTKSDQYFILADSVAEAEAL